MVPPSQSHDTGRTRSQLHRRRSDQPDEQTALDRLKPVAMATFGGVLLLRSIRRGRLRGIPMALVGGWLLSRGLRGLPRIDQALRPGASPGPGDDQPSKAVEGATIRSSTTIGKSPDDVFEAWRDPDTFSQVMGHIGEVTAVGEDRYRWTIHVPGDRDFSWETHIVEEEPGELIRWETPADTPLPAEGTVRFQPAAGDRGTTVLLTVRFNPPGGTVGARLFSRFDFVPETATRTALDRFKSLVETGEISTLAANPSARGRGDRL